MSVFLLIRDREGAEGRIVPIATEQTFAATWVRGGTDLGLEWIELMQIGFDVTRENHAAVGQELESLRIWLAKHGEVHGGSLCANVA